MSREEIIAGLKKYGYTNIKVKGGVVPLIEAPSKNLYYMYKRITGKLKGTITIGR
jgi:hypothetical protein